MLNSDSLEEIKRIFDRQFADWGIALPAESLMELRRGSIYSQGWTINYRFGMEDGVNYLEYFASHRMTNDTLNRIYADGRAELLGFCQVFFTANDQQAEREYYEHNRQFYEEVRRRGLQDTPNFKKRTL